MSDNEYRPPGDGKTYWLAQTLLLILFSTIILFVFLYLGEKSTDRPPEPASSDSAD